MKRLIVFSSFDSDNIVDEYVLFYIEKLSRIGDIIFVSDNPLDSFEHAKLDGLVIHCIAGRHGEYDFGSYKKGIQYAIDEGIVENYDWLILCNDSVYGPFYCLSNIFEKMESRCPDVWGFTINTRMRTEHLQSYFISLSKRVFSNSEVVSFFYNIKGQDSKEHVIHKYEIGFSELLKRLGYKITGYFDWDKNFDFDPQNKNFYHMIMDGYPFLKRNLLKENVHDIDCLHLYRRIKYLTDYYPFRIMEKNLKRVVGTRTLCVNLFKSSLARLKNKIHSNLIC